MECLELIMMATVHSPSLVSPSQHCMSTSPQAAPTEIHPWTRANDNYCAINQVRCIWVVHTCSGITYTKVSFSLGHLHCTCNQKTMSIFCTKHVWYNTLITLYMYMSFSISEYFQAEKGDVPKELCRPSLN